ncbi:tetratricopeptide repeat protein [Cyanobium sp. N.Huapi 1H5]|uniref:tetratricopeptide repeat protein n=1 Tax=Cyanobium sp. N.Huapi 1H5 TaxID=2823719 RepID=UPI0020CBCAD3|nr:tetratricopeptide repeat protein [Cyanobium sp. N.Huapi 1H5]MCP9839009.1 tetratricopeptide repeat protein [Cyanobium sp. N.Huapi 1H5]
MGGPQVKRLAKLRGVLPDGRCRFGSGYRVCGAVVLTAAHVVDGLASLEACLDPCDPCRSWRESTVLWRGGQDLALVRLEGFQQGEDSEDLVRLAPLGRGITSHVCDGVGFPDFKERHGSERFPAGVRDSAQLKGELRLGANLATGHWELQLDQNPLPPQPHQNSPWPGISGTAVLVGDCLVGVVVVHELREGSSSLTVQPLQDVLADPGFCQALSRTSRPLFWNDPWGLLRAPHEPLPSEAARSPAVLLRPEYGVVPFEGRQRELEALETWLGGESPFRLWLLTGGGGNGKTRLIGELAQRAGRAGWLAGWLPAPGSGPLRAEALAPHRASGLPLLLLLDEAHWRPTEELVAFLAALAGREAPAPCRLVLVARTERDWWEQLELQGMEEVAVHLAMQGARRLVLEPLLPEVADRPEAFQRAAAAFSMVLGRNPPATQEAEGRLSGFEAILTLQAEALLRCLSSPDQAEPGHPQPSGSLWSALLGRERIYWQHRKEPIEAVLSEERPQLAQLVGLASLCGAQSPEAGREVLRALPWLRDAPERDRRKVEVWLRNLYPGEEHWPALKPDRLADALLAQLCREDGDFALCLSGLSDHADDGQLATALNGLGRLGQADWAAAAAGLDQLLGSEAIRILPLALAAAPRAGAPLVAAIERQMEEHSVDPAEANRLLEVVPQRTLVLAPMAVSLTSRALEGEAGMPPAMRARLLNNLSVRLGDTGDRVGALEAIEEALDLYRELAAASPDAFLPDLAMSLNNLANRRSDGGDRAGALQAVQEALDLYRELAAASPQAFRPDLAMSLNNFSNRLSDGGDRVGALRAVEEALEHYWDLAAAAPDAFRPDLAMSLNNLSLRLADNGDRAGALRAIEEAVTIRRELVAVAPDAFRPALARCLNNLSLRRGDTGDQSGALKAIEEAVDLYRELTAAAPDTFRPDLAASLNNYSNVLSDAGNRAGALKVIQEAVDVCRELAAVAPDAFRPALARCLNNLSNRLTDRGDQAEALQAMEESVDVYRELSAVAPDAFRPELAMSLNNLSLRLADKGDRVGALQAIEEAVNVYRELSAVAPDAFRPELAMCLNNLSSCLSDEGDWAGAMQVIQEAVEIDRKLAKDSPAAFRSNLAETLNNLSSCLSVGGDRAGALKAIDEVVEIYRVLAVAAPDAFRPALADALDTMARCLCQNEQTHEALEVCTESLEIAVDLVRRASGDHTELAAMIRALYVELCEVNQVEPEATLLESDS